MQCRQFGFCNKISGPDTLDTDRSTFCNGCDVSQDKTITKHLQNFSVPIWARETWRLMVDRTESM
eukprot:2511791-Karenia_brevis.AAC.1